MYPPGHVGLTAVLFAPLVGWLRFRGRLRAGTECLCVGIALSLLPDIDALLPGIVHRGVTHTLLAAVVVGAVVVLVFRLRVDGGSGLEAESTALCYLVGVAGVVSHLIGDVITPMGIQPLFPGAQTAYSLEIVQASSPAANFVLVAAGTVAVVCSYAVPVGLPTPGTEEDDVDVSGSPSGPR